MDPGVAFFLVLGAAGAVSVLVPWWRSRRLVLAERVEVPLDHCVACGGERLDRPAPDVVLCRACGFLGGPGAARHRAASYSQEIERWSPERRREAARQDLESALLLLHRVEALIQEAREQAGHDRAGTTLGSDKHRAIADALLQLRNAHELVASAGRMLESAPFAGEAPDGALAALDRFLDESPFTDGWLTDRVGELRIQEASRHLRELRRHAQAALRACPPP